MTGIVPEKHIIKVGIPESYTLIEDIIKRKIKNCVGKIDYGETTGSCCFVNFNKLIYEINFNK